jgi:RimJ/RimL family protein N-acetyltransferase
MRAAGRGVCFAVTLRGCDTAIGIVQVRRLDAADGTEERSGSIDRAEWGFAIGSPFWGGGIFTEAARLVLGFVFDEMQVRRLEARSAVRNGRAAKALRRLGAQAEGLLRNGLFRAGEYLDQTLYAIDVNGWRDRREESSAALVH